MTSFLDYENLQSFEEASQTSDSSFLDLKGLQASKDESKTSATSSLDIKGLETDDDESPIPSPSHISKIPIATRQLSIKEAFIIQSKIIKSEGNVNLLQAKNTARKLMTRKKY